MQDHLPKHSDAVERETLGAMLRDVNAVILLRGTLPPEFFYSYASQELCAAIYEIYDRGGIPDVNSVISNLNRKGILDDVGGANDVYGLLEMAATTSTATESHSKTIVDLFMHRRYRHALQLALKELDETDQPALDMIEQFRSELDRITDGVAGAEGVSIQESGRRVLSDIDARMRGERPATMPTGFPTLDLTLCGGLKNGHMTVLAARTSKGKTAFALAIARNIAKNGNAVFFVSLEQQHNEITERNFSSLSGISGRRIISGDLDKRQVDQIMAANDSVQKWKFVMDTRRRRTAQQIVSACRRQIRKFGMPTLVVVDYISLIQPEGKSKNQRYQQVGEMSRELRNMAEMLQVPVVVLAQLNREAKDDELPEIRHIRESGDIEQDADCIMLLHQESKDIGFSDSKLEKFRLIVAKQRNGPTNDVMFDRHSSTFNFTESFPS